MAMLYAFGGLLLGGILGFLTKQVTEQTRYSLYTFSAGVLIGILSFELVPETFANHDPLGPLLGIAGGMLLMMTLDIQSHQAEQKENHQQFLQVFLFLSLAISIHNIPTGIAFGTALANQEQKAPVLPSNSHAQGLMMGVAIGGIGYVAAHEMLWKVRRRVGSIHFLLFLALGLSVVQIYLHTFLH